MQPVEGEHPVGVDDGNPGAQGMEVGPAGEWFLRLGAGSGDRLRHRRGGVVLRHIVSIEAGREDPLDAGSPEQRHIVRGDHPALLEHPVAVRDGMGQNGAYRVADGNLTELHRAVRPSARP